MSFTEKKLFVCLSARLCWKCRRIGIVKLKWAMFSLKPMPFLNEKREQYQIGAKLKYFQRAFKWLKILICFFKIQRQNGSFKSASFFFSRMVKGTVVHTCACAIHGSHATATGFLASIAIDSVYRLLDTQIRTWTYRYGHIETHSAFPHQQKH